MQHQISKKDSDTVIIIVEDDEPNSSDKEAYLDVILHRADGDSWGNWGTRYINSDSVEYHIPKKTWDDVEFQKKYILLMMSL